MKKADFIIAMDVTKIMEIFWFGKPLFSPEWGLDTSAQWQIASKTDSKETSPRHSATGTVTSFLPRIQHSIFDNLHHQFFLLILSFIYYKSFIFTQLLAATRQQLLMRTQHDLFHYFGEDSVLTQFSSSQEPQPNLVASKKFPNQYLLRSLKCYNLNQGLWSKTENELSRV